MAEFLAQEPIQHLIVFLSAATALFAVYYFGGNRTGARPAQTKPSGFGNDAAILKLVVEHAHEGLLMQDIYGHIEWTNPAYSRITGYSAEEIRGRRPQEFVMTPSNQLPPEEIANFKYDLSKLKSGDEELILNRRKNGENFWNQLTFAVVEGKTEADAKIILICRDVTSQVEHVRELEEARTRLKYQAEHDDLTGVANRAKLTSYLQGLVASANGAGRELGVIHCDLDHFKDINDSHGHSTGDAVLRHTADVLTSVIGDKGLVSRIGGDEFLAIVDTPDGPEQMDDLGSRILKGLEKPLRVDHQSLSVAGSVGLVLANTAKTSASEIINHADIALYEAKKSGRGRLSWYTDALGAAHRMRRLTMAQLDQDLETGNLSLMMEPEYSLSERRITGYEVSARWLHPSEGLVDPIELLSCQEDAKLIAKIERFALYHGLAAVRRLRDASGTPFFASVNLSQASLNEPSCVEALTRISEEFGFPLGDLYIELDEQITRLDEPNGLMSAVNSVSAANCKITLDKFGGGHGGAGQLVYLGADAIKISPMLVAGMEKDANKRKLVQAIISLAASLDVKVSAAGVDSLEQAGILREFGCSVIQGKAVSAPLSPREAEIHVRDFELETEMH